MRWTCRIWLWTFLRQYDRVCACVCMVRNYCMFWFHNANMREKKTKHVIIEPGDRALTFMAYQMIPSSKWHNINYRSYLTERKKEKKRERNTTRLKNLSYLPLHDKTDRSSKILQTTIDWWIFNSISILSLLSLGIYCNRDMICALFTHLSALPFLILSGSCVAVQ